VTAMTIVDALSTRITKRSTTGIGVHPPQPEPARR
jgi:hypothetical protein